MNNIAYSEEKRNKICSCCGKETIVDQIEIPALGYSSFFDSWSTKLQICEECKIKMPQEVENFIPLTLTEDKFGFEVYKGEEEFFDWMNKQPLPIQELFYNSFSKNGLAFESQDWIDLINGCLSEEKKKEYGVI